MLPAIIIGGALYLLFKSLNEDSFQGFEETEIDESQVIDIDKSLRKGISEKSIKSHISKVINRILRDDSSITKFKIGKTGSPSNRAQAEDYSQDYDEMYILAFSKDADYISRLETYYTDKYFIHRKNGNKRRGSAGKTVSRDGFHFLYVVIRW